MFYRFFFSTRFKYLRLAHNLSGKAIVDILGIKSAALVTFWENGTNIPSLDLFNKLTMQFGVSPSWLLGYSSTPFDEDVLTHVEDFILTHSHLYDNNEIYLARNFEWITPEYLSPIPRRKTYSFPVRANLIFLFQRYIACMTEQLEFREKMANSNPFVFAVMKEKQKLELAFPSAKSKKVLEQNLFYINSLKDLLIAKESAKPIFDIQAQKTTEE